MDKLQNKALCLVVMVCVGLQCYARAKVISTSSSRKRLRPSTHPPAVMHGDLCARLNGRKFYLEPDASALLYAFNVTLPPLPKIAHPLPRPPPRRHRRDDSFQTRMENLDPKWFRTEWRDDSFKTRMENDLENKESSHLVSKIRSNDNKNDTTTRKLQEKNSTPAKNSKSDIRIPKQHGQETKHRLEEEKRSHLNFKDYPRMKSSFQQFSKSKSGKIDVHHENKSVFQKAIEEISHKNENISLHQNARIEKLSDKHENSSLNQNTKKDDDIKSIADAFEENQIDFTDDERKITDNTRKFSANINGLSTLIDENEQEMEMMRDQAEVHNTDDSDSKMVPALSRHLHCGIELFTCTECHLEFTFRKINLPSCSHDQTCRCDYLRLREPPYIGSSGGLDVCSSGVPMVPTYTTQTREVSIDFFYTTDYRDAFTISVISKRNRYRIQESSRNGSTGYIRSPFFPELYPKDYWVQYELLAINENRRVKITFLDFQISPWSFVEVQDTNESRLAVFSGNIFRPPVLISSGPHLTIRFNANGETSRGFNLQYSFISKDSSAMIPPKSDCGGYVTNFGGTITMMNMAKGSVNATLYDCVWIIQPPQNFAFKTHVLIKVVQFEAMAAGTSLELRQGLTSDDYLLETITGGEKNTSSKEHVVSVDTGFYVRLQGFFSKNSKIAIVYTSFSVLGNCYAMTDHMCHNHRCIPKMLRCDGFDHCGDNSDEPTSCYGGMQGDHHLTPEDQAWWYQHTPNYYFPQKTNLFTNPYGSSMMLLFSLFVLILIIIGLVSYMVKQGNRESVNNRRHRDRTHRNNSPNDGVEIFDAAADDPPDYEAPPDYEEVIKFILSGNNLKLVRRPGGLTAWMPDVPKRQDNSAFERNEDGTQINAQSQWLNDGSEAAQHLLRHQNLSITRPLRTRHSSLDMEQGEVVLWNSNANLNSDAPDVVLQHSSPILPNIHTRRPSLPSAPQPELMQEYMTGHSVSMAPSTIMENYEGTDSPLLGPRHAIPPPSMSESLSFNPSITNVNNNELADSFPRDISSESTNNIIRTSSVHSLPGPSTSKNVNLRKSKSKNAGKRRKTSAAKKSVRKKRDEEAAPPSYEMAMQQSRQNGHYTSSDSCGTQTEHSVDSDYDNVPRTGNERNANDIPGTSTSEQIVPKVIVAESSLLPSQRIKSARKKFQELSKNNNNRSDKLPKIQENLSSNVSFRCTKARSTRSGGTISKGTVKARKAMLMRAHTPSPTQTINCNCNGACSCANFKKENEKIEDCLSSGAVKSKVDYYLNNHLNKDEYDSSEEVAETEIKEIGKSSRVRKKNSPYSKKKTVMRNKSAPHSRFIYNRDLEIYFSQNNEDNVQSTTDIAKEIIEISKDQNDQKQVSPIYEGTDTDVNSCTIMENEAKEEGHMSSDEKQVSSIRKHVDLYNDLAKNKKIHSVDSAALLNGENGHAVINVQALKSPTLEAEIKSGIVKDAKEKYIASTMEENKYPITHTISDIDDTIIPCKQIYQEPNSNVQQEKYFSIEIKQPQEQPEEGQDHMIDLDECQIKDKSIFNNETNSDMENNQQIDSTDKTAKLCKSNELEKRLSNEMNKERKDNSESNNDKEIEKCNPTSEIISDVEELRNENDITSSEIITHSTSPICLKDMQEFEPIEEIDKIDIISDECAIRNENKEKMSEAKDSTVNNTDEKVLSSQTQTLIENEEKKQPILLIENENNQIFISASPSKESSSSIVEKDCSPIKSVIRDNIEQPCEGNIIKDIKEVDKSSLSSSSRSNSPAVVNEEIIDPIIEYIRESKSPEVDDRMSVSPTSSENDATSFLNITSSSPRPEFRDILQETEEEILHPDQDCTKVNDVSTRSGVIVVKDGSQIRWDYI